MSDFIKKLDNILLSEARRKSDLKKMLRMYKPYLPPYIVKDFFHNFTGRWVGSEVIDDWTMGDIRTELDKLTEYDWEPQTVMIHFKDLANDPYQDEDSDTTEALLNRYIEWANPKWFYSGSGGKDRKQEAELVQDTRRLQTQLNIYRPNQGEPITITNERDGLRVIEGFHRVGVALLYGHKDGPVAALKELSELLKNKTKGHEFLQTISAFMYDLEPVSMKAWVGTPNA